MKIVKQLLSVFAAFVVILPMIVFAIYYIGLLQEQEAPDDFYISMMESRLNIQIPNQMNILHIKERQFRNGKDILLEMLMTVDESEEFDIWASENLHRLTEEEFQIPREHFYEPTKNLKIAWERMLAKNSCLWMIGVQMNSERLENVNWLAYDPDTREMLYYGTSY